MAYYSIETFILFILFSTAAMTAELETQLKRFKLYNDISTQAGNSEDAKRAGLALKQLKDNSNDFVNPNAVARLYYQTDVDAKPCSHCPKYLNLTLEVNKIVEKAKADKDPAVENDAFIQLSKLKFMYYVVRSENENGAVNCQRVNNSIELNPSNLDGNFKVIKDVIVRMPEISDFQYYPKGKEDAYYYYRGEGAESNIVIEVVMHKDGKANLRYYEFQADDGSTNYAKQLQHEKKLAAERKGKEKPDDNFIKPIFELKTGDTIMPKDITLLRAGAKAELTDDVNILLGNESSVNEQTANVVFERGNGQKWIIIQGKNITDGGKSVSAAIPLEVELDQSSKLKVNGKIENTTSIVNLDDIRKGNFTNKQSASVSLKDEEHEYLNTETNFDSKGFVSTTASNKFKLSDSTSIGSSVTYERSGQTSFSLNASTSLLGDDKLQTSFGTTSTSKPFVSTQYEKKFSETGTLVLGTRYEQNNVTASAGLKFAF